MIPVQQRAFVHICEVCNKTEQLTSVQAHQQGWDYPPKMGAFGVVSMRTCPNCPMIQTAWWAIAVENKKFEELTPQQQVTVLRIQAEQT